MTKEQLVARFVDPYEKGDPILIKGKSVNAQDIERLQFFRSDSVIDQYVQRIRIQDHNSPIAFIGGSPTEERAIHLCTDVTDEFISGPPGLKKLLSTHAPEIRKAPENKSVFIVHGHDNGTKSEVARFVERFKIEAIILHENASSGRTIIEKIEHYTNVGFAIVIYTPDDIGNAKGKAESLNNRARQNVVFEHGYLVAKLGRSRVAALVEHPLELPSDISGVVYISLDEGDAWKLQLSKEMKQVGYAIDMNLL